jgi:hypothetical protein
VWSFRLHPRWGAERTDGRRRSHAHTADQPPRLSPTPTATQAQYNAVELLTMRDAVSAKVRASLTARAKDFNIELDDVALTHLSFGEEVRPTLFPLTEPSPMRNPFVPPCPVCRMSAQTLAAVMGCCDGAGVLFCAVGAPWTSLGRRKDS